MKRIALVAPHLAIRTRDVLKDVTISIIKLKPITYLIANHVLNHATHV